MFIPSADEMANKFLNLFYQVLVAVTVTTEKASDSDEKRCGISFYEAAGGIFMFIKEGQTHYFIQTQCRCHAYRYQAKAHL